MRSTRPQDQRSRRPPSEERQSCHLVATSGAFSPECPVKIVRLALNNDPWINLGLNKRWKILRGQVKSGQRESRDPANGCGPGQGSFIPKSPDPASLFSFSSSVSAFQDMPVVEPPRSSIAVTAALSPQQFAPVFHRAVRGDHGAGAPGDGASRFPAVLLPLWALVCAFPDHRSSATARWPGVPYALCGFHRWWLP